MTTTPYLFVPKLATQNIIIKTSETTNVITREDQPLPPSAIWVDDVDVPFDPPADMKDGAISGVIQRFIGRRLILENDVYVPDNSALAEGQLSASMIGIFSASAHMGRYAPVLTDSAGTVITRDGQNPWLVSTTDGYLSFISGPPTSAVLPLILTFYKYVGEIIARPGEQVSSIIPVEDAKYDLGSADKRWRNLYVGGTAYLENAEVAVDLKVTQPSITVAYGNTADSLTTGIEFESKQDGNVNHSAIIRDSADKVIKFIADTTQNIMSAGTVISELARADIEAKGITGTALTLSAAENQLTLGATSAGQSIISATAQTDASDRTYTLPAVSSNCQIIVSSGAQEFTDAVTFNSDVILATTQDQLKFGAAGAAKTIISAASVSGVSDVTISVPEPAADAKFVITNAASAQEITSDVNFIGDISVGTTSGLVFGDPAGNHVKLTAGTTAVTRTITIPAVESDSEIVLAAGPGTSAIAGNRTFSGLITMSNTTEATDINTAALKVAGGVSIVKDLALSATSKIRASTNSLKGIVFGAYTEGAPFDGIGSTGGALTITTSGAAGMVVRKANIDGTTYTPIADIADTGLKMYSGDASVTLKIDDTFTTGDRIIEIPDSGVESCSVVLNQGAQTLAGVKTMNDTMVLAAGTSPGQLVFGTSATDAAGTIIKCLSHTGASTRTITIPSAGATNADNLLLTHGDQSLDGKMTVLDATEATALDAALTVAGGISVAKNVLIGAGAKVVFSDPAANADQLTLYSNAEGTEKSKIGVDADHNMILHISGTGTGSSFAFRSGESNQDNFAIMGDRSGLRIWGAEGKYAQIAPTSLAADRVITIPDPGVTPSAFILADGAQTFTDTVTFSSAPVLGGATTSMLIFGTNSTTQTTISCPAQAQASELKIPAIGAEDTIATLGLAQTFTGDKIFSGNVITTNTAGILFGGTGATSTKFVAPAHTGGAQRTITIPDIGAATTADVLLTNLAQTVAAQKTFTAAPILASPDTASMLIFGTSNALTVACAAQAGTRTLTIPAIASGTSETIATREAAQTFSGTNTFTATPVIALSQNQLTFGTAAGELTTISCVAQTQASTISLPVLSGGYSSGTLNATVENVTYSGTHGWMTDGASAVVATGALSYSRKTDGTITAAITGLTTAAFNTKTTLYYSATLPAAAASVAHSYKIMSGNTLPASGTALIGTDGTLTISRDAGATFGNPAGWWSTMFSYGL